MANPFIYFWVESPMALDIKLNFDMSGVTSKVIYVPY